MYTWAVKMKGEEEMKEYLQKLGKSLMMPISIIAAAGIFLGLASVLQNPAIVGESFTSMIAVQSCIGFIRSIVSALFGNLPVLFAVSVAIGLAKGEKTTSAFSAVIGFILFHTTISYFLNLSDINGITTTVDALVQNGYSTLDATRTASLYESVLGIFTYRMNVFGGVLVGILVASVHNRFYKTELPMAISYFGGKRLVPIMTTICVPILGVIMFYLWPFLGKGIESIGNLIADSGAFGVFLFGFIERLLVPTGLHHILNQLVRFTPIGGVAMLGGEQVVGALNIFNRLLTEVDPDMNVMREATRFLAQGKIPFMVFGLPAACLAMYQTSKKGEQQRVKALLLAAAIASFTTGITEPIEFSFIFVSPILFIFHALMSGLSFMLMSILGVSIGNVQGGFIDLVVFGALRGTNTNWYFTIVVGIIYALTYYFVFKWVILRRNVKTPGREDDASDVVIEHNPSSKVENEGIGHTIISALGGVENIQSIDNCFTRLRLVLNDSSIVDERALKTTGAAGVMKLDHKNIQVVYGPQVEGIALKVKDAAHMND